MTPVLLDFESRSRADLPAVGGRRYWEHPTSEALCAVWYDTADGSVGVWAPGQQWPHAGRVLAAHNAFGFDRFAAEKYGFAAASWIDTAQLARKAGLPGALDALGSRWLGLPKDKDASKYTKGLSSVRRPKHITASAWRALNDEDKRRYGEQPTLDQQGFERVVRYCARDVEIMAHAWPRLAQWLPVDRQVEELDQVINDRGVAFDSDLARRLLSEDERLTAEAVQAAARELGMTEADCCAAASSPAQFCELVGSANAQAATIETIDHPLVRARQALASIARGKLLAGLARVHADGRLRDTLLYYGAHTGRWSGRGMQVQNMPRPTKAVEELDVDAIVAEVLAGRACTQDEVSAFVRATLTASPGHVLVTSDLSSIEARATAWAGGDRQALAVYASDRDPYKVTAAAIYGVSYDEVTSTQRQVGKVAELACLSADTLVLTDSGWRAITDVRQEDRLWDGAEWVQHSGVVPRGEKRTMRLAGLRLTPDHPVLAFSWTQAGDLSPSSIDLALAIGSANLPLQGWSWGRLAGFSASGYNARAGAPRTQSTFPISARGDLHAAMRALGAKLEAPSKAGVDMKACARTTRTESACSTGFPPAYSDATTPKQSSLNATGVEESKSIPRGGPTAGISCATCSPWSAGTSRSCNLTGSTTIEGTSQATCVSPRSRTTKTTGGLSAQCKQKSNAFEPVYDIAHAGPRNRFTVLTARGPIIVHNCGYQGGPGAFERFAKVYRLDLSTLDPAAIVKAWRILHSPIVQLWSACASAFRRAARAAQGVSSFAGPFEFVPSDDGKAVACFLPSGRPIVYHNVQVGEGGALSYLGRRGEEHIYGGKLVENAIQGLCRDIMADAMLAAEDAGLRPVMTIHDEIVCDVPREKAEKAAETLSKIMTRVPAWAAGMPIGAKGWTGFRYKKG